MSAISDMLAAVFADEVVSKAAVWTPAGGSATAVRVVEALADEITGYGQTRIRSDSAVFEILRSEAPSLAAGDSLVVAETTYTVKTAYFRDPDKLVWTVECSE